MDAAKAVTATFTLNSYPLSVGKEGNGSGVIASAPPGVDCGGDCTENYLYSTLVTLTATANVGSNFVGWAGACSGTAVCPVTMDAAKAVTATFTLNRYPLSVGKEGNGSGVIASAPPGVDCGGDCTESYLYGTVVTLTATATGGSSFTGWTGACSGAGACQVTMDAAKTVTATFTLNSFPLSVGKDGNGSGAAASAPPGIDCGGDCTENYLHGTVVTLTATAASGSSFAGWSGACTGVGACQMTMDAAKAMTATFMLNSYPLSVGKDGNGNGAVTSAPLGINCGEDCSESYLYGIAVTLTATANNGSSFTGWAGACTGVSACQVTMDAAKTVTATFTLNSYPLSVGKDGNGSGAVFSAPPGIDCGGDCTESYLYGTLVTLTATANVGSNFVGWAGACSGTGACPVTMGAAKAVTATFTLNSYPLSVGKEGNGSGVVASAPPGIDCGGDCAESYLYATVVTLTATTTGGSSFTGWTGACSGVGACQVTIDAAKAVTATFMLNSYPLSVGKDGNGSGAVTSAPPGIDCGGDCTENYLHGTVVTLTATAAVGSSFTGWAGACTGVSACPVTMDAAKAVTATFTLNSYPLSVGNDGNGSGAVASAPPGIDCGGDCTENYLYGTKVTLTATAAGGSGFTGWTGACSGVGACQVTMDAAKAVTATFSTTSQPAIETNGQTVISQTIEFTATLGLNSYDECTWDFDDGATAPCQAARATASPDAVDNLTVRATHAYVQPGQYTVTVTARNAAGEVRATLEVNIRATADSAIFLPVITR